MRYAALGLLFSLTACSDRAISWTFTIDATVRPDVAWIEAEIVEGGCDGEVIDSQGFAPGAASMTPPRLGPGTYGFRVRAQDASCDVIAENCVELELPAEDAEVSVPVSAVTARPACESSEACEAGRCTGGVDAGGADAGMPLDGGPCDGCFDGTECVAGDGPLACGSGGAMCEVCCGGESCTDGRCVPTIEFTSVAAGRTHTCAVAEGRLYCWGSDTVGELGDGLGASLESSPVSGDPNTDWTQVSTFNRSNLGLRGAGVLESWGSDNYGQLGLGDPPGDNVGVITPALGPSQWDRVSAGYWHSVGLDPGGALYCWGNNGQWSCGQPITTQEIHTPIRIESDVWTDASAGHYQSCGIRGGGLYCWGVSFDGETGTGATGRRVEMVTRVGTDDDWVQVVCGSGHTCARHVDGTVECFGCNDDDCYEGYETDCGYDPNPDDAVPDGDCTGKLGTGTVGSVATPMPIAGGLRAITLDANAHTCLITMDDMALYCWGPNEDGQLGVGDTMVRDVPTLVSSERWEAVSAGPAHTCAIREGGALYCWGRNADRQLGLGEESATTDMLRPARACPQ